MTSAAIMRFGRFALALVWLFGKGTFQGDGAEATAPVHAVDGTYVKDWLVLGPFLSQDLSADLLALINEILDLSKIESGRMELAVVDFDLRDLISGTAVMFEPRCRQKGLQWRIEWNVAADGSPRSTDSKISGVTSAAFSRTQFLVRGDEGKLRLESELGRGSRFRFALHLLPALGEVAPKSKRTEGRVRRLQDGVVVRALAADDIVENQHVLEHFLMDLGVEVTMAAGGEEAWTQLCAKRYGIAFLDIQMPGMTGIDIANRVVKEFGPGHVKLVAISASVLSHEQQQDAEIGFDGFVPKPFRFEHLCECLENLLGVKFEYEAEPTGTAEQRSLEGMAGLTLPPDLLDRLRHAAEMDSVTEFDGYLREVEALGETGKESVARLRELSRNVQIEEILKILSNVRAQS